MNASPNLIGIWGFASVLLVGIGARPRPPRRSGLSWHPPRAGDGVMTDPQLRRALRRRGAPTIDPDEIAAWCERLARALRSGTTLIGALREADPPGNMETRFGALRHDLDRGIALEQALEHLPADPHLDLVVTALVACRSHGVDAALPLEQVASVLRWRGADAAELRSQSAQAKASSKVMTILPIAMLVLLIATSGMVRTAVASPMGVAVVVAGGALNLAGWMWMRHLILRATR